MGFGPTGERAWPVEAHMQRAPCCRVQAKSQIAEVLSNHCRLQHSPNFHCAGFLRELRGVSLRPVRFKVLTCCRQVNILNRRVRQEAPQRMQRPTKLKRCTETLHIANWAPPSFLVPDFRRPWESQKNAARVADSAGGILADFHLFAGNASAKRSACNWCVRSPH